MDAPPIGPFGPHEAAERVVRPKRRIRAGVSQALALALGAGLGLGLPRIGGGPQVDSTRTVEVLASVGVAVLGVTSLVYSVLFLVVQWAAGTFTPRLALFRTDPLVWRVLAFAIGVLIFSVVATLAIGSQPTVSVAVPAAALALTALALGMVRGLQLRAFRSIQLAHVLADTAAQAHRVLDAFYPRTDAGRLPAKSRSARTPREPLPPVRRSVSWPMGSGGITVEQVAVRQLVDDAEAVGATVVLRIPAGATVYPGDVVADVCGGDLPSHHVTRALIVGRERTFHQDPIYPLRVLADIGLRALSPAVNDPATAVQTLDAIEGLLLRLVGVELDAASVPDERGAVRVILCLPAWTDFLGTGMDELCRAAEGSPMVLSRARITLRRLAEVAPEARRASLAVRLDWVERQLEDRHPAFMRGSGP